MDVQVEEAMRRIERMLAHGAPYEEIMESIDACEAMPGAVPAYLPGLQSYRMSAMELHGRPDRELRDALERFLGLEEPLLYQATSVIAACADRPALAAEYLPPLIAKLEAAIAATHDEPLVKTLASARKVCERLGVGES